MDQESFEMGFGFSLPNSFSKRSLWCAGSTVDTVPFGLFSLITATGRPYLPLYHQSLLFLSTFFSVTSSGFPSACRTSPLTRLLSFGSGLETGEYAGFLTVSIRNLPPLQTLPFRAEKQRFL